MQTVLITGANGFVGWYLATCLLNDGRYHVLATGKGPIRLPFGGTNFTYTTLDFTDSESVAAVFRQYKPTVVVHAGAISKPDDCELDKETAFRVNVSGTVHLLHAAAAYKSHFIFISTDFVFEGKSLAYKENDALHPVNYYGQTKVEAEAAVKRYPFSWAVVRTVLVYGKPMSGRQNLLTNVVQALRKGETLKIFNDQMRTPTYVEDLATALAKMIDKKSTGIFHISGKDVLTPYQMAVAAAEHEGLDARKIIAVTADAFKQPALRPPITGFDLTQAETELEYVPTLFATGLAKTFLP
jgi:dTDP-4-dehydrorhamnose reductase